MGRCAVGSERRSRSFWVCTDLRIGEDADATGREATKRAVRSEKRRMAAAARRTSAAVVAAASADSSAAWAARIAARVSKWARRSEVVGGMMAEV